MGTMVRGVIVAKEGDTYYVATAAHVIQTRKQKNGRNVLQEKIAIALITPTQERIVLSNEDMNVVNVDLDIGIVKFKSKQNYQIANIGRSEFERNDWVFVSGFPGKDANKQRLLTIGSVQNQPAYRICGQRSSIIESRGVISFIPTYLYGA